MTRIGDIGTPAIVNSDSDLAFYVSLALIRVIVKDVNIKYLYYYIQSQHFKRELYKKTIHNAFPIKINKNEIGKCLVILKNFYEQTYISDLLSLIDKKLSLANSKIKALKKYKEGLILKALKPTIENWKSGSVNGIRLSSFLVPYKKLGSTNKYIHATLSKEGISDKTERYNRDFLVKDENKKYRVTVEGDLVYNPANLKFGVICINRYGTCVVSPIYETFKVRNIDRDLLESIVTSKSFIRYALKFEEGTVYERRAVSVVDLLSIKICVDDNSLDDISNILKIVQRKIDLLNYSKEQLCKFKSYLLNVMFI